jgi:hypothetical protein
MKDNMFKTYWELQSKFIDLDITERWLLKYNVEYSWLASQLNRTIELLETQYEQKWKIEVLEKKLVSWIDKASTLLFSDKLSSKSRYLLLKIKKAFIKAKYL